MKYLLNFKLKPLDFEGLYYLPRYNFINNFLLFACGLPQINSRCFNAFVSHKVGKQRYIVKFFQKILCKTMPERVWIYHFRVQPVFNCIIFKLLRNSTHGNSFAKPVQKQVPARNAFFFQPRFRFDF